MLNTKEIKKMRNEIIGENVDNLKRLEQLDNLSNFLGYGEDIYIGKFRELEKIFLAKKEEKDVELGGSTK